MKTSAATGALVSITLADGQTLAVSPAWLRELQTGSALGAAAPDTITDALGRVTSLVLDGLGRLLSELAPDGSTTSETPDFAGDPTSSHSKTRTPAPVRRSARWAARSRAPRPQLDRASAASGGRR